jgi:hypothetical protein
MDKQVLMRYIGNALLLIGYWFLLFVDQRVGLVLRIIAPLLFLPSCIRLKLYDILFLTGVFLCMDAVKLLSLLRH